jgi:hypothetical protein
MMGASTLLTIGLVELKISSFVACGQLYYVLFMLSLAHTRYCLCLASLVLCRGLQSYAVENGRIAQLGGH